MTVIVAAAERDRIAMAADGMTREDGAAVAMLDNVKVVPLFGPFAVAWAGAGGLMEDARFHWSVPEVQPPVDRWHPSRHPSERDPINLNALARLEELVLLAERSTSAASSPSRCLDVIEIVWNAIRTPFGETV